MVGDDAGSWLGRSGVVGRGLRANAGAATAARSASEGLGPPIRRVGHRPAPGAARCRLQRPVGRTGPGGAGVARCRGWPGGVSGVGRRAVWVGVRSGGHDHGNAVLADAVAGSHRAAGARGCSSGAGGSDRPGTGRGIGTHDRGVGPARCGAALPGAAGGVRRGPGRAGAGAAVGADGWPGRGSRAVAPGGNGSRCRLAAGGRRTPAGGLPRRRPGAGPGSGGHHRGCPGGRRGPRAGWHRREGGRRPDASRRAHRAGALASGPDRFRSHVPGDGGRTGDPRGGAGRLAAGGDRDRGRARVLPAGRTGGGAGGRGPADAGENGEPAGAIPGGRPVAPGAGPAGER